MKAKQSNTIIMILLLLVIVTQPATATKSIPTDTSIGTWDPTNRIYTLTTDVFESIKINEDNLTFDGAEHTVTGAGSSIGIDLFERTGIIVKNVTVEGFSYGIRLHGANNNTITGNTVQSNITYGIALVKYCTNNEVTDNRATSNSGYGIWLGYSSSNTVSNNTVSSNSLDGIALSISSNNTVNGNTVSSNNQNGILIFNSSNDNTVTDNTASSNINFGIALNKCNNNMLTGNTSCDNGGGVIVADSSDNTLTGNTTINNNAQGIYIHYNSSNNIVNGNTVSSNTDGIFLSPYCSNNTVTGNTAQLNSRYGINIGNGNSNIVSDNTVSDSETGILLASSNDSTIVGNTTSDNVVGICLQSSSGNTLTGNTTSNNSLGISLKYTSNSNTLSGNITNSNKNSGIHLNDSHDNSVTGNEANGNGHGIYLQWYCSNNIITANTASSNNGYGIIVQAYCTTNTVKNNTATNNPTGIQLELSNNNQVSDNRLSGNANALSTNSGQGNVFLNNDLSNSASFALRIRDELQFVQSNNDFTNSVNGISLTKLDGVSFSSIDLSTLQGGIGVNLNNVTNSSFSNITVSGGSQGLYIDGSSSNTLSSNTLSKNHQGFYLHDATSNTLTANTTFHNDIGIAVSNSSDNKIYNNCFFYNATQASVSGGSGNLFYLSVPQGGNYWSDWTGPDADDDGFVDAPYIFSGGQDDLPWAGEISPFCGQYLTVNAGDNLIVLSANQAYTIIQGTGSDPQGNPLDYRWLEGELVLLDWSPVGTNGEATLDLGILPNLPIGDHTLTLKVSDGLVTFSDTVILTIQNSPAAAQPAPSYQIVEIGVDSIVLVANVADFDGDVLFYEWIKGSEVLASGTIETVPGGDVVPVPDLVVPAGDSHFPLGIHEIELRLDDGVNIPVGVFVSVEVVDTSVPSLSPIPSVTMLWPPDHKFHPVTIQANAFDNAGGAIDLEVEVQSSEPADGIADGSTEPDYYIDLVDDATGVIELRLRAERAGSGNGRVYTVTITATDENGNQSVAVLDILAPHDRRAQ